MKIQFAHPLFLFFLPIALMPVLIYLIAKNFHKKVDFGSFYFLKSVALYHVDIKFLRYFILFCRCCIFLFLIFYFASPTISTGGMTNVHADQSVIFLMDCSYSMQVENAGESLLDSMQQYANRIINIFYKGAKIGYVAFANHILGQSMPFTYDQKDKLQKILNFDTVLQDTDVLPPLQTAYQFLAIPELQDTQKSIIIVSDMNKNGWHAYQEDNLLYRQISNYDPYVSIFYTYNEQLQQIKNLSLHHVRIYDQDTLDWIYVDVSIDNLSMDSFSEIPIILEYAHDDLMDATLETYRFRTLSKIISFDANESKTIRFQIPFSQRLHIGRITIQDRSLKADNSLFFTYQPTQKVKILSLENYTGLSNNIMGSFYISEALSSLSDKLYDLDIVNMDVAESLDLTQYDLIIFHGLLNIKDSFIQKLEDYISNNGKCLIALASHYPVQYDFFSKIKSKLPGTPGIATQNELSVYPHRSVQEKFSILDSEYDWDKIKIKTFVPMSPVDGAQILLELENAEPILILSKDKNIAMISFDFNLVNGNDFVVKPVFVPFLKYLMENMSLQIQSKGVSFNYILGVDDIPVDDVLNYNHYSFDQKNNRWIVQNLVKDTMQPGIFLSRMSDGKSRALAVNVNTESNEGRFTSVLQSQLEKNFKGSVVKPLHTLDKHTLISNLLHGKNISRFFFLFSVFFLFLELYFIRKIK